MIKNTVVSTDGLEPPMAEPKSAVLPITPCAEKKLPALTSKEYKKVKNTF